MEKPDLERNAVRFLVAAALTAAVSTCALVPAPRNARGDLALPAPAFGQSGLYRLEFALLVFYGSLLLVTPAFSGLVRGKLPIEISVRGAKFAEDADRLAELTQARVEKLEVITASLADEIERADLEKERKGDSTQPGVDSSR